MYGFVSREPKPEQGLTMRIGIAARFVRWIGRPEVVVQGDDPHKRLSERPEQANDWSKPRYWGLHCHNDTFERPFKCIGYKARLGCRETLNWHDLRSGGRTFVIFGHPSNPRSPGID